MPKNQDIQLISDFSTFLSLISFIIFIQSSIISRKKNKSLKTKSDNLLITSVFISACTDFIDLSLAKKAYDDLINSPTPVDENNLSAAKDLLTSRVFAVLSAIYLIRATLTSTNLPIEELVTPTNIGNI